MNSPRKVSEVMDDFYTIKKSVPVKVVYLFAELCELVESQSKELEILRNEKKIK